MGIDPSPVSHSEFNNGAVSERSTPPPRTISLFTAASESDFRNVGTSTFQLGSGGEESSNVSLSYCLKRLKFYSIIGCVFLLLVCISCFLLQRLPLGFLVLTALIAFSVCASLGIQKRDWRMLIGTFILSFIIFAYLTARCLLAIVITIDRFGISDAEMAVLGFSNRAWMAISDVLQVLLSVFFCIFWAITCYYSERVIRLFMDSHPHSDSNPSVANSIRVVGNPVYLIPDHQQADNNKSRSTCPKDSLNV